MNNKNHSQLNQFILFNNIREDEIFSSTTLICNDFFATPEAVVIDKYYSVQRALMKNVGNREISGNYLQDYFCKLIASEENIFTLMSEAGRFEQLKVGMPLQEVASILDETGMAVFTLAANEIEMIYGIYNFDFVNIEGVLDGRNVAAFRPMANSNLTRREFVHKALSIINPVDSAILLSSYYRSFGSGVFEAASAFELNKEIEPLKSIDPIKMNNLIGYDRQKQSLIENTEILLKGIPANNVLLYGDSGTGKSSSVKALLNMYADKGLKMVSVSKDNLIYLPELLEKIASRGMKFIIYIDDLSFEENEVEYKTFKSVIEGSLNNKPINTIFVVTSNRRNIVKEVWSDRRDQDDVRMRDNIQEKRSLSDRFGLTLIYSSPDKEEYLQIVKGIAHDSGLIFDEESLLAEALQWEIRHGGRSGRAARQFVDYKIGKAIIENQER